MESIWRYIEAYNKTITCRNIMESIWRYIEAYNKTITCNEI